MSFERWWNNEISESSKSKLDLSEISIDKVKQWSREIQKIRQQESEDSNDDLQDLQEYEEFFDSWCDTLQLEKKLDKWKDKEIKAKEMQESLYEKLWINLETENNPDIVKFVKWLVDWLVINNLEEIEQLLESSIDELLEMFDSLLNPEILVELIKQAIQELWDIWSTFENPYKWWLALWALWIWPIGKIFKWLKLWKNEEVKEAIDKDKTDFLEMKWTYKLDEIKNLTHKEAGKKIEGFANSIDIDYLIDNPERIDWMLNIINGICNYIDRDINHISKLTDVELKTFKYNFNSLRKTTLKVLWNDLIPDSYKKIIERLKINKLDKIYNKLNN